MNTIVRVLSTLASGSLCVGCSPNTPSTEVPGAEPPSAAAGEHACGNHAEGACGSDASPADADAPTSRTFEVQPGKFAEANFTMKKGATVSVKFSAASSDLAWDVHSHDHDGGTKIHDEGRDRAGTVEFTAPEDGVFSVLWRNEAEGASPLDVEVTLSEGATIHSWMPD